jgi:hypothetical protein
MYITVASVCIYEAGLTTIAVNYGIVYKTFIIWQKTDNNGLNNNDIYTNMYMDMTEYERNS